MRLIDADEMCLNENEAYLKAQTSGNVSAVTFGINSVVHRKIQQLIADTPTIEAAPVIHGRWESAIELGYLRCSCCENVHINEEWLEDGKWLYCPGCGAKMDE